LGGRKQIQSSPQSHTDIYFAQARRELDTDWRTRATLQEDEQLQLGLPQEEQLLLGFLEEVPKNRNQRRDNADPAITTVARKSNT